MPPVTADAAGRYDLLFFRRDTVNDNVDAGIEHKDYFRKVTVMTLLTW